MKKIKTIKELNAEKKKLLNRRYELEKAIYYDWKDLKHSVNRENIMSDLFSKNKKATEEQNSNSIFTDTISEFARRLTLKLAEKAEGHIYKRFKK
ncbi:MAG: hypothetical protein ABUT20_00315 [Bacteroidota bacterium]